MLVGIPWLAWFAARSLPQVGHFSAYSIDDWLAYQAAGYRIFMYGFWLEGGSTAFDVLWQGRKSASAKDKMRRGVTALREGQFQA